MKIAGAILVLVFGFGESAFGAGADVSCHVATRWSVQLLSISDGADKIEIPMNYTASVTTFGALLSSAADEQVARDQERADCLKIKRRAEAIIQKGRPFEPIVFCGCSSRGMVFVSNGLRCVQLDAEGKVSTVISWLGFESISDCRKEANRQMSLGTLYVDSKTVDRQLGNRNENMAAGRVSQRLLPGEREVPTVGSASSLAGSGEADPHGIPGK